MKLLSIKEVDILLDGEWKYAIYYKEGVVYRVMNGDIFDAWLPVKKIGRYISVYDRRYLPGQEGFSVPRDLSIPELSEENFIFGERKELPHEKFDPTKIYFAKYCKMIEGKGFQVPTEQLSEEEEKEYIEALKQYIDKRDIFSEHEAIRLEKKIEEIAN